MSDTYQKVLIICYYWPPAGGPGVQRWLKFVKYLTDFGYEPHVYVPENPTYPIIDTGLLDDINPKAIIIKRKIREPYGLGSVLFGKKAKNISSGIIPLVRKQRWYDKLLLWIRGNMFIPDARVAWVKPSVSFLKDYIQKHQIEKIITSGPPHSLHLIGFELKKVLPIAWTADFRDPWTTISYHKKLKLNKRSEKRHQDLEKQVLQSANHILVTSDKTKAEFEKITHRSISVLTNGYDRVQIPKQSLDTNFTLSHIGSFLSDRNPRVLWKALRELCKESKDFKKDFRIQLYGKVSQEVIDAIHEFKLNEHLDLKGYVSHLEAQMAQRRSQLLLLVEIDAIETQCIIPGKLFEYMVAERPILAIGPEDSDVSSLIKKTNTGMYFTYEEKDEIKHFIWTSYKKFKENNLQTHPIGLQQFSRKSLTQELVRILNEIK